MEQIGYKQDIYRLLREPRVGWHSGAAVVLGTALVALCAHIAVPLGFTPIPVTMQTFAVLLLGLLLGPREAFFCLTLYLAEGLVGMPVFSPHGPGGMAQLIGPSGGYLLSYPFAAALASMLYRRGHRRFPAALGSAGLANILILAAGATWLGLLTHVKPSALFTQSIAPFLPGDAIKILAASACVSMFGSFGDGTRQPHP
jgi:biotin transport system substrate-specific component